LIDRSTRALSRSSTARVRPPSTCVLSGLAFDVTASPFGAPQMPTAAAAKTVRLRRMTAAGD
jgi:hypothetical protein